MTTQNDNVGGWAAVARLAAEQHGVVGRAQLRLLGLTDRQIGGALGAGRLHRLHRGVFAVGHERIGGCGREVAAVIACGPSAALAYRSAGAHWNLRPWSSRTIEVLVVGRTTRVHDRVVVHRHPGVRADEITTDGGLRVTTVPRTLLDLGAVLAAPALRSAVAQAEILQLFDLGPVEDLLRRHPRHRGAVPLRDVLRSWVQLPRTRSPQEEAFPDLCARLGLPMPVMNGEILGMEVDAVFPDHGVAVELDSARFHSGVIKREDDHARRARLVAAGWTALTYTLRQQVEHGGRFVLETLGPALARGRPVDP